MTTGVSDAALDSDDVGATAQDSSKSAESTDAGEATVSTTSDDVQRLLAERISALEGQILSSEPRAREVAKKHKKSIREVQRIVADTTKRPEEIIAALQQRTLAALNDAWRLEKHLPELEAKIEKLVRQSKLDQDALEKGCAMRNKLQELCRELQKQNKVAQLESRLSQEEEKSKRQEMVDSVNSTVASITERLEQQAETVNKQAEENALLKDQLKRMLDALQATESHSTQQAAAHDLERQIWEARQQQQAELIKKLEERGDMYAERYEVALKENALLMKQVQEYNDRFQEFQGTLTKSNEMFTLLKNDAKASRLKEKDLLEKNAQMQQQYEKAALMLLKSTQEGVNQKDTIAKLTLANDRLQSLCRALQGQKAQQPQPGVPAQVCKASEGEALQSGDPEATEQEQHARADHAAQPACCVQE